MNKSIAESTMGRSPREVVICGRKAVRFFDRNLGEMALILDNGWLCRQGAGDNWITYRKATKADYVALHVAIPPLFDLQNLVEDCVKG